MKAVSPKTKLHSHKTAHAKMICQTYDGTFCTTTAGCCGAVTSTATPSVGSGVDCFCGEL